MIKRVNESACYVGITVRVKQSEDMVSKIKAIKIKRARPRVGIAA